LPKYLIIFIIATALSLLLTPLVRSVSRRFGAMDLPDQRKVHKDPIPRLGGVSIFLAFNLILLIASRFEFFFFPKDFLASIDFVWLLLASFIVLGLGAVDDFGTMPPHGSLFPRFEN
jgi:UDP-GlcNAc:undecaprenyl-phosphate GlcNAc-1-phosphate transferase